MIVGPAGETLPRLAAEGRGPFDLIFIDADKVSYGDYLRWSLRLSRPGTLIIADNVVRDGRVIDPTDDDPNVVGVRQFNDMLARRAANATILPRGTQRAAKGYDGLAIAVVTG